LLGGGISVRGTVRCPGHKKDLAESTATVMFFHKVGNAHLFYYSTYPLISSYTSGFKSVLVSLPDAHYHYSPILGANTSHGSCRKRVLLARPEGKLDLSSLAIGGQ